MSRRGFGVAAGLDAGIAEPLAGRCAALGYDSVWSNDTPMASGLETLAAFHAGAPEARLGVGVLALDRHAPEEIAADIARLGLPADRLWIGIGAGFSKRPLGVVREGVAAMRAALPAGAGLAVAAMGPRMCALAGELADGVFLNWMTPERGAWARERVAAGATAAGRETPTIIGYVRAAVGADAPARLLKEESFYRQLHQGYANHFASIGAEPGTVGVAAADAAAAQAALAAYEASHDLVVVRALASANFEALVGLAEAIAPAPA